MYNARRRARQIFSREQQILLCFRHVGQGFVDSIRAACTFSAYQEVQYATHIRKYETNSIFVNIVFHFYATQTKQKTKFTDFTNRKLRLKTNQEIADDFFDLTWKQSLSMLGSYVDLLAPELLAVWEMREEITVPVAMGFNQRVLNWLESSTANLLTQSQDKPDEELSTPVNTQELVSVSQEHDLTYIEDSDMLQDLLLPGIKSRSQLAKFSQNR